jgi:signal transduction histidine kinase
MDQAEVTAVDVNDGLRDTLVMLTSILAGVRVQRELDEELPRIEARGGELNQVWTHLIDNAVAAMGGQGELVVRSARDDDELVVQIIDSGPGIPSELQARIFDPFVTTKPVGKGAGLGLNISRNIVVNKHGGTIAVTSRPGRTCFVVRLPLRPTSDPCE